LAILVSWRFAPPAQAALDPELKKPYRLEVVLDIAKHRLLTDVFVDRLEQDLRDGLQAVLSDLAQVTMRRQHPLLEEIREKGLEKTLDGYKKVSEVKTHFVLVDFEDGRYKIQARQHDGLTGMASPQVRRDQTADRGLVARTAVALVELDFGLVGTVTGVEKRSVKLAIKAGGLGMSLKSWVNPGEVFAIAAINRGGSGLVSAPLQWALLQVTGPPRDGVCDCRLYNRFLADNLIDQPDVLGYRCLKLGTLTRVPLRLRLLDFKTHAPHDSLQVHVSGMDFGEGGKKLATDRDGMFPSTGETYSHVVFVRVLSGGKTRAQIPVALVSPRTVDCLVSINAQAEAQGQKEVRRERWLRRIYDSLRAATDRVSELNDLGKEGKRQEALDRAREGLDSLANDLKSLNAEHQRLAKEGGGLDLSEGEHRLTELTKRRQELDGYVTRLGKVLKEEKDPAKLKMLSNVERARLLETQAEFQQALDLYEKILKDHPKEMAVRKRYAQLEKAWAIQNEEHRKARDYIYKTWPTLGDPAALKTGVNEARKSLTVCQKYGDALSPQKLLRVIDTHAGNLKKRFATLKPQASEDDRKEGETIVAIAADLKKLHAEVTAYLKAEKPMFP
jgi:tetratricopeptide (TPR) repeat protein